MSAEPQGDETRDRLVAAAARVFAEKGYDRAGVQEIARRAGLTTGAIYGRFAGKAELLRAAIECHSDDELSELFNRRTFEGHAGDIIKVVGSHLVTRPVASEDALLLEAFVAARRDAEVRDGLLKVIGQQAGLMAELIESAKADGTIDPGLDTESLVRFCHAVGLGFVLYDAISLPLPAPGPWEELITRLVASVAPTDQPTHPSTEGD